MNADRKPLLAIIGVAVLLFVGGIWVLIPSNNGGEGPSLEPHVGEDTHPSTNSSENPTKPLGSKQGELPGKSANRSPTQTKPMGKTSRGRPVVATHSGFSEPDMGEGLEVDPKKHVDWDDPVNQKVLGSPDWMAEPSKELEAQMAQALKRATRIPDPRIKPLERRSAIEALRPVVDQCYADAKARTPGLIGRVIVTFEASSTDTQGMVQNVRLSTIVKLDADPGFRTCVLSNADGLRFPASEAGESRTVEYPFFYDGSY